eukprot:gene6787-30750_t
MLPGSTISLGATRVIDATLGVGAHDGIYASTNVLLGQIAGMLACLLACFWTTCFSGGCEPGLWAGVHRPQPGGWCSHHCSIPGPQKKLSRKPGEAALPELVKDSATAIGYSTPPVLTMNAAASAMPYVISLVMGNDMVPRAGIVNVKFLIDAINGPEHPPRKLLESPFSPLVYDYAATSVDSSLINGAQAVYPMYAPGTLYQMPMIIDLVSPDPLPISDRIKCSKTLVAAADATERFKSVYFKLDMVHSHSLQNVINCLAQL